MPEYLHTCHQRRVHSGELSRLTRVVEAYVNRQGEIALTDQNERLFDYGDQRITPQQKIYIQNGNRRAFWNARKKVGDPIARVALPILEDAGVNGKVANWLTGLRSNPEKLNALGVDLMIEHAKAVTIDLENCVGNVPGVLSPE
jgi:hypothetical protein